MPELPDVTVYIEALEKRILGRRLENLRIVSPFLLRSVEPPVSSAIGKKVVQLRRLGKRICIGLRENSAGSEESEIQQSASSNNQREISHIHEPTDSSEGIGKTKASACSVRNDSVAYVGNQSGSFDDGGAEIWLVLHLMIAGRLHWKERLPQKVVATIAKGPIQKLAPTTASFVEATADQEHGRLQKAGPTTAEAKGVPKLSKQHLAAFDFENGSLLWTEAGSQKRASLYLAKGEEGLAEFDRGGMEVLTGSLSEFSKILRSENHTLKRALTDPEWFSGIGNAYSDEILWQAKLSPLLQTKKMNDEEIARLFEATRKSLTEWTERLRAEMGDKFPEKVTAFRPEMAVHGKYKQDCPRCGSKVQRIKYASNETNYCPTCQTGGKLLADRAISRLLREDWPKTPEEMEMRLRRGGSSKL